MMTLFMIVTPGLEDLALRELELKCPTEVKSKIKGGIEVTADIDWIIAAHTSSKIPTRILLRVTEFKVRDFPKLHQKFENFKWNTILSHPHPQFEISCSKSRLMHSGRIEETVQSALNKALIKQPLNRDWEKKNYPPQTFYIRLHDDLLTLSLDLTGEPLYKRGLQKIKGEAPIRENLAAAFLFELLGDLKQDVHLVDPMCGSGTFLTEALNFHRPLHLRPFAFETAPFFKGKHFQMPNETAPLKVKSVRGFDLNKELVEKIEGLNLEVKDSLTEKLTSDPQTVMIVNPPYGERIQIKGKRGSFLKNAWEKFLTIDQPMRFAWILPSDMDDLFKASAPYELLAKRHLKNGGISVTFWIWENRPK